MTPVAGFALGFLVVLAILFAVQLTTGFTVGGWLYERFGEYGEHPKNRRYRR